MMNLAEPNGGRFVTERRTSEADSVQELTGSVLRYAVVRCDGTTTIVSGAQPGLYLSPRYVVDSGSRSRRQNPPMMRSGGHTGEKRNTAHRQPRPTRNHRPDTKNRYVNGEREGLRGE